MTMTLNDALQVVSFASELMNKKATDLACATPQELVGHYQDVRKAYDALAEVKKLINAVHDRMSVELIPDMFRRDGIKTINLTSIGRVTVAYRYSCSMIDKTRGIAFLKSGDGASLVQETVNAQSLAAYAKSLMVDQGKELPAELFKTSTAPYTSITKA